MAVESSKYCLLYFQLSVIQTFAIGLPYHVNTKLETQAKCIVYFSEHIQGTWVITSKPDSEVEDEIGAT
jgi:hypothetical protein